MRFHNIELFSDYFAQKQNVATLLDARIKLLAVVVALVIVLLSQKTLPLITLTVICIAIMISLRIPLMLILKRFIAPLFMASMLLFLNILGGHIAGAGMHFGLLAAFRILAGSAIILLAGMTTPLTRQLSALYYFKIPETWVALLGFTYRYIFVFIEQAQTILDAQRLRLGYSRITLAFRSWGVLMGSLFSSAFDQAQATHEAMLLRGYNGTLYVQTSGPLTKQDIVFGIGSTIALFLFSIWAVV